MNQIRSPRGSHDWPGSLACAPLGYAAVGGAVDGFGIRDTLLAITVVHVVIHRTRAWHAVRSCPP
ncbi:hypothetical protein AB0D74_02860 [Streptomyces sp. NPDC048278]|uniref:hypothetical protein n=1 Tax=Streptomyces sp. NPDC048278 TaxID=3155809 RepID=UPI0034197FA1